jgi:hypothetical protein
MPEKILPSHALARILHPCDTRAMHQEKIFTTAVWGKIWTTPLLRKKIEL